ncbi:Uncharacterised protein [Mycobacteroides abscessus subsp. abscessus]|nr:Uncharacterised protein [Mycobacteroides abscessus subsp. abscessus]
MSSLPRLRPSATTCRFSAVVSWGKLPDLAPSNPTAVRSSVVLPAPLCPMIATTESSGTVSETPWITSVRP